MRRFLKSARKGKSSRIKKNVSKDFRNKLQVEFLEPRVLLSADPLSGGALQNFFLKNMTGPGDNEGVIVEEILKNYQQYQDTFGQGETPSASELSDNKAGIDISRLFSLDTLNPNIAITEGITLKGSGETDWDLLNEGIVSPGYSPGSQTVDTFTQTSEGILEIELAGLVAGTQYDQLNVNESANFGGTLKISLLDGFKPNIGDTFDIITYGSATGLFTNLAGLYGFHSDYYFELVQTANKLQLVTREIVEGDNFSFVSSDLGSKNDTLGMLLNAEYLAGAAPTSVTLSGAFDLGDTFSLSGQFTFEQNPTGKAYTLSDATTVNATTIKIGGRDINAFFGVKTGDTADHFGMAFTDVDFGMALFEPVDQLDTRSWIVAEGALGGVSFCDLSDLSFTSGHLAFALELWFGAGKQLFETCPILQMSSSFPTGQVSSPIRW
jgi:hypothetical protein